MSDLHFYSKGDTLPAEVLHFTIGGVVVPAVAGADISAQYDMAASKLIVRPTKPLENDECVLRVEAFLDGPITAIPSLHVYATGVTP